MPPKKFGGAIRVLALAPEKDIYSLPNFVSFFCYVPNDLAPVSYKNPLLMIKYELSTSCRYNSKRVVKLLGSAKKLALPRTLLRTSAKNSFY